MSDRPPFEKMNTRELADWCAANDDVHEYRKYPLTLDGAAAAMPEKTCWMREWAEHPDFTRREFGMVLVWTATPDESVVRFADTGDEIHDRFRLAAECRWAMKENQ